MKKTLLNKKNTILSLNDIVYKFLDNDLERFLKRWYRFNDYQLVYSELLPKWGKDDPEFILKIKRDSRYRYPGYISRVCNVLRVMEKHYAFHIDWEDYQICEQIESTIGDRFDKYVNDKNIDKRERGISIKFPTRHQAIKELKAQGFIDVNDFEDFDKSLAQVMSRKGMGTNLVYPQNFMYSADNYKNVRYGFMIPHVNNMGKMIGVRGFSRISTPNSR